MKLVLLNKVERDAKNFPETVMDLPCPGGNYIVEANSDFDNFRFVCYFAGASADGNLAKVPKKCLTDEIAMLKYVIRVLENDLRDTLTLVFPK